MATTAVRLEYFIAFYSPSEWLVPVGFLLLAFIVVALLGKALKIVLYVVAVDTVFVKTLPVVAISVVALFPKAVFVAPCSCLFVCKREQKPN